MLMSLCAVRLLDGLRAATTRGARFRVHSVWVVQKLTGLAFYWWILGWLRDGVVWTAASFLWILLVPTLLFVQVTALVTTTPDTITSWRQHFFAIRRWFFSIEAALALHSIITSSALRGVPLRDPLRVIQVTALATAILGVSTARPQLHEVIGPVALVVQVLGLGTLFFRP